MNIVASRTAFFRRFAFNYAKNIRRFSASSLYFVQQQNVPARRETDFLQPTSRISSPLTVCVMKNYFISFGLVDQPDVGKAVQVVEYHLNCDVKAHLILTFVELRELCEAVKPQLNALMEKQGAFSSIEKCVELATIRIWEDMDCGLRVLRISHSTPLYNNLRPLVVPFYNLKEFLNQVENVLMNSK